MVPGFLVYKICQKRVRAPIDINIIQVPLLLFQPGKRYFQASNPKIARRLRAAASVWTWMGPRQDSRDEIRMGRGTQQVWKMTRPLGRNGLDD